MLEEEGRALWLGCGLLGREQSSCCSESYGVEAGRVPIRRLLLDC